MSKRFKELYKEDAIPALKKEFGYVNPHEVPKISSVVLSMGVGAAISNSKIMEVAARDLSLIAGQKATITLAKKSVAAFKLRQGMKVGCKVTLRNDAVYDFLERLVYTALPRVKGFRGLSGRSFDGRGNFNFGIPDYSVFPEIRYDDSAVTLGLNVHIIISGGSDKASKFLLNNLNIPFIE